MTTSGNVSANVIPTECSDQGFPLHWERRCAEVAIEIAGLSDVPREELQLSAEEIMRIVSDSFAVWEAASGGLGIEINLLDQASSCDLAEFNSNGGNMNTIIFANDWPERGYTVNGNFIPYDPSAFAVTTAWHNDQTGVILDADIEINELRGPYIDCQTSCTQGGCVGQKDASGRQVVDLQNVLTHEAGHFFGLDHPALDPSDPDDESLATMWAKSPAGEVCKRVLKEDDIEGLQHVYPAEVLSGSCDFSPYGGRNLSCGQDAGGCACSTSTSSQNHLFLWMIAFLMVWLRHKSIAKRCKRPIAY